MKKKNEKSAVKKPVYKKWWFWVIIILFIGVAASNGNQNTDSDNDISDNQIETINETEISTDEKQSIVEQNTEDNSSNETSDNKTVEHREGMYGISDKDINNVDAFFTVSNVRNDVTGNWRISTIAENIAIEEYALSYYNTYFENDSEIHGIVNFTNNTTTRISKIGDRLDVSIYEYIDGEEHDAKMLFSGMLLKEYFVYLDNGDIEEVDVTEDAYQ